MRFHDYQKLCDIHFKDKKVGCLCKWGKSLYQGRDSPSGSGASKLDGVDGSQPSCVVIE